VTTLTRKKILDTLKDKETREIFAEEHVSTGLPFQIHGLREKLGLTQAELARRAGMAQERISVLEDPNYEFLPKINTLIKLANVFDVPLIVKFGSWSELFNWETNLSPERLAPKNFEEEIETLEEAAAMTANVSYIRPEGVFYGGGHLWSRATVRQWYPAPERSAFDFDRDFITLSSSVFTLDLHAVEKMLTADENIQEVEEEFSISEIPAGKVYLNSSSTQFLEGTM
jgi:transcriptional regulator with XRE-family HTH domain